jgi:tripartite-type tricarboxylate transporter receptor subunit TctC
LSRPPRLPRPPIRQQYHRFPKGRKVPTKTVREFIAYANANPGKVNIASGEAQEAPQGKTLNEPRHSPKTQQKLRSGGAAAHAALQKR